MKNVRLHQRSGDRELNLALLACFILFVLTGHVEAADPVKVLYTGDPYPGQTPYIHMKVEPILRVTPIQASRDYLWGFFTASDISERISSAPRSDTESKSLPFKLTSQEIFS